MKRLSSLSTLFVTALGVASANADDQPKSDLQKQQEIRHTQVQCDPGRVDAKFTKLRLVYDVVESNADAAAKTINVALRRRLGFAGFSRVGVHSLGNGRIAVEVAISEPNEEKVARVKKLISMPGVLQFRILANGRDHAELIEQANKSFPKPVTNGDRLVARWLPVADKLKKDFGRDGELAIREADGKLFVLAVQGKKDEAVDGDQLATVEPTIEEPGPAIAFSLTAKGAAGMGKLTAAHLPSDDGFRRRLAIILDDLVYSAPSIMARVGAKGVISGRFTQQEVDDLIVVLRSGRMPVQLVGPIEEALLKSSHGLIVEPDPRHLVASRLEGIWTTSAELNERLGAPNIATTLAFKSDPLALQQSTDQRLAELADPKVRIYMAGTVTTDSGEKSLFLLINLFGNPTLSVLANEDDGQDSFRSLVTLAAAENKSDDLLFILPPSREQRRRGFLAFERFVDEPTAAPQGETLSVEEAKWLIPRAASISDEDFRKLATSASPSATVIKSKSLSLLILSLKVSKDDPKMQEDFKFIGLLTHGTPKPSKLAEAIWDRRRGYATFLRHEYITNCICDTEGETAKGTVWFKRGDFYQGKANFVARRVDGQWRIEEFSLPNYGLTTVLGPDGVWNRKD